MFSSLYLLSPIYSALFLILFSFLTSIILSVEVFKTTLSNVVISTSSFSILLSCLFYITSHIKFLAYEIFVFLSPNHHRMCTVNFRRAKTLSIQPCYIFNVSQWLAHVKCSMNIYEINENALLFSVKGIILLYFY